MPDLVDFYERRHLLFTPCGVDIGDAAAPRHGLIIRVPRAEATCRRCAALVAEETES